MVCLYSSRIFLDSFDEQGNKNQISLIMNTRLKTALIFFSVIFVVSYLLNRFILNVDAGLRYNLTTTLIGAAIATVLFTILPKKKRSKAAEKE